MIKKRFIILSVLAYACDQCVAFQHNIYTTRTNAHLSKSSSILHSDYQREEALKLTGTPTINNHELKISDPNVVDDNAVLMRRNVIGSVLAATASCMIPRSSFASSEDAMTTTTTSSSTSTAPFTVILSVQTDPKKDDTFEIEIEVRPDWAPLASNRFRELVENGFYNDSRFFRVLPGYVAQFGIAADPKLNKEWMFCEKNCRALQDEIRKENNKRGTLSFASSGKNSRQTQVFINLGNNDGPPNFLDAQNFVPFARVVRGMDDTVKQLKSEYGMLETVSGGLAGSVNQGKAAYYGAEYLDATFPKLSIIRNAKVI